MQESLSILKCCAYAAIGLSAGFLSKLLGVGGGVLIVPALVFLFAVPMPYAIGTSLAFIFVSALAGALQDAARGQVGYAILLFAVPFGVLGTFLGTYVQAQLDDRSLRMLFGVLMILVGIKMVFIPGGWADVAPRPEAVLTAESQTQTPDLGDGLSPGP